MKRIAGLLLALIAIGFTSCITIEEIYTFRSDGSGNMKYVIDMSEAAGMLKAFKQEDEEEVETENELEEAAEELQATAETLKSMKGISNVANTNDNENFIFTLSFDFASVEDLNKALNEVIKDSSATQPHEYFTMKGKNLIRNSKMADKLGNLSEESGTGGDDEASKEMANMMLEQMKYNLTFNFEKGVKSVKTKSTVGELSGDKKQYTMKANFKQLSENQDLLDASFKLK